jgi:hypothetical protein
VNPFDQLEIEHERTSFVLHGWREASTGEKAGNYFTLAHSLSEAVNDLASNPGVLYEEGDAFVASDVFVMTEEGDLTIHVELVHVELD